jgi:hypothetical protein
LVTETNDYIFGDLHNALRDVLFDAIESDKVSDAMKLSTLPEAPRSKFSIPRRRLKISQRCSGFHCQIRCPRTRQSSRRTCAISSSLRHRLPFRRAAGRRFPDEQIQYTPLLIKAARAAVNEAPGDDVRKRLMIVPRCHVQRLSVVNEAGGRRVDAVITERGPIPVSPDCKDHRARDDRKCGWRCSPSAKMGASARTSSHICVRTSIFGYRARRWPLFRLV